MNSGWHHFGGEL